MMVSNNPDFSGATWESYVYGDRWCLHENKAWALASGSGTRTVYFKLKDTLGHESAVASDSMYVDLATGTISINNGDGYTTSNTVTLSLTAADTSGQMMISNNSDFSGASWEAFSSTKSWVLTGGDGVKTVYAKFKNSNGEISLNAASDSIGVDSVAPNAYVTINGGNYTSSSNVTLHVAGDAGYPLSPIAYMMVSNNPDFSGATWEPYSYLLYDAWWFHDYNKAWTLTSGSGTRTVYFKLKDTLGHESAVASDSIIVQ
jgi:hypothetical protein